MPTVLVAKSDQVLSVNFPMLEGKQFVELTLLNAGTKMMNLDVFSDGVYNLFGVRSAYQRIVGKKIDANCWDPAHAPGKWSGNGWFQHVIVLSEDILTNKHIAFKGPCGKCGVADGMLTHRLSEYGSWFHKECISD